MSLCRTFPLLIGSMILLWSVATAEPEYQQVNRIDLVGGHVPDGTLIEVTGRVWATPHGIFFGIGMPSAMAPIKLDVAGVAPEEIAIVTNKCKAGSTFEEGCQTRLRGKTGRIDGRRGVFATSISPD